MLGAAAILILAALGLKDTFSKIIHKIKSLFG
jgi:hypothetical protein